MRNMPPIITEDKRFDFDGNIWSCQLKAPDPDCDSLTYSIKKYLPGMTINPSTGLIQWNMPPDFKGKAKVTVSVTDGHV